MARAMNVYAGEGNNEIAGQAKGISRDNLDQWNGHNWANGGVGMHLGLAKIKRGKLAGKFVAVKGIDLQGLHDYAFVVSVARATEMIVNAGSDLKKWGIEAKISE